MAHAYAIANSETKPEFTDYTIAGTVEGRHSAALLRINYEAQQDYIEAKRQRRPSIAKQMVPHAQALTRCGYPQKRERDEDMPSKRHVPHSKFLKRFKLIYNRAEDHCKVYVLHATRGWKLYA